MAGSSSSSGNSSGTSNSDPTVIQTPQSEWGLQLSQSLAAIMNQMIQWAGAQYAKGSAVTDNNIQGFLDQAGQAAGFANNLLSRYTSVFEPLEDQFVKAAQSYNSEARQKFMMGQAESTAGQADQAGMDATKRALQEAGVNVNSGKYAELTAMERMKDAATRAGAGTQAFQQTEQMGRQMMQTAVQFGQNVPGMWATAANTRTAALNAAQQAILGLLNTGANMMNVGANYGNAAGNANRIPPIGNTSRSQQQSNQRSGSMQTDPSHNNSDGSGGRGQRTPQDPSGGSGRGTGSRDPRFNDPQNAKNVQNANYRQPNAGTLHPTGDQQSGTGETGSGMDQEFDPFKNAVDPSQQNAIPDGQGGWIPLDQSNTPESGMDQEFDPFKYQSPPTVDPANQQSWDQSSNQGFQWPLNQPLPDNAPFDQSGTTNSGMDQEFDPWQNVQQQAGDWQNDVTGSINQPDQSWDDWQSPQDASTGSSDQSWDSPQDSWDQFSGGDQSGMDQEFDPFQYQSPDQSSDYSGGYDESSDYAKGGVVPTTGGHVPRSASPSGGRTTDDIPARLNADEFVIPKDVHLHRGTRFFNNLIAQSRKSRTGMAGPEPKAKMRPALRMKPTFTSRYMGQ